MLNSTKRITVRFQDHTPLGSPKGHIILKSLRYHGASIKNTCCYYLPSTEIKSIGNI